VPAVYDPSVGFDRGRMDKFRRYSARGFPRFASALRGSAESYDREAERVMSEHQ